MGGVIGLLSIPFCTQGHGILWFMYTLTGLYLLVPVISPWLKGASKREIELYLFLWMVTLLYPFIGKVLKINNSDTGILYYFTGYAGYFLLGYYMNRYQVSLKWLLSLAMVMLPLPIVEKTLGWGLDFYTAFWYLSAPVCVMATAWFACTRKITVTKKLNEKAMQLLVETSNLSFGIYLVHIFVMRTILYNCAVVQGIKNFHLQTLLISGLTFAGSWLICYVISRCPLSQYVIGYTTYNRK